MIDRFGREIEYLRVSITENCNLNCIYCSPGMSGCQQKCPAALKPEEFERIVRAAVKVGVNKVRITGGEPLVRKDVLEIVERISGIPGIEDLSMTTNGIRLDKMAEKLKKAGLHRLNISLDSLKPEKFRYITGGGELEGTLKGIDKAMELGLTPVKINTVLIRGINDDEIEDFIQLTRDKALEVRFIELMPIGRFGEQNKDKVVPNSEIIEAHSEFIFCEDSKKGAPASYYRIEGHKGKVGFISAVSHKFCSSCNRVRLTSDGKIRPCLGNNGEMDVTEVMRNHPEELDAFIEKIIYEKPEGHNFGSDFSSLRNMSRIGG
jgi:cyclic pyranopterin phosphate synthase